MPNRILREAILTSERVATLGWPEEVFYRRLMSIVDDHGRHEAGHQLLRAKCYPLQTDSVRVADIARWMAACQKSGLILVYGVSGKQYLELRDFGQQVRSASKCPAPDSNCEQVLANAHLGVCVSGGVSGGDSLQPDGCPHADIVALYHEALPANPRIKTWTGKRQSNLRARWREDAKRQSLDYWRRFFAHVSASPFLTGQRTGQDGRAFLPGLDWLVMPENFAKVIEGRYHDKGAQS